MMALDSPTPAPEGQMDRRTIVAIERFTQLMEHAPNQEYDPYLLTSMDERNHAQEHRDRILPILIRVVRQAQEVLREGNVAWEDVELISDELLAAILDPTMLDEEALREVEIYVRNHF